MEYVIFANFQSSFIMDHDKKDVFRFAALQVRAPEIELQKKLCLDPNDMQSFILIEGNKYFKKLLCT